MVYSMLYKGWYNAWVHNTKDWRMAMKKSEMEDCRDRYHAQLSTAKSAEGKGLYRVALEAALASWDHIDGMVQYAKRYENNPSIRIEAITMVLGYAPLLLDLKCLDKLEVLLEEYRRIEKNSSENIGERLSEARRRVWDNHRLWNLIAANPDIRQDDLRQRLGGEQDYWRGVIEAWAKMGLVNPKRSVGSYTLSLATRLGQVVSGICPACGMTAEAPKAIFFEKERCPKCKNIVFFVILPVIDAMGNRG